MSLQCTLARTGGAVLLHVREHACGIGRVECGIGYVPCHSSAQYKMLSQSCGIGRPDSMNEQHKFLDIASI
eukprot:3517614-Prymnesium_polylepis.1